MAIYGRIGRAFHWQTRQSKVNRGPMASYGPVYASHSIGEYRISGITKTCKKRIGKAGGRIGKADQWQGLAR